LIGKDIIRFHTIYWPIFLMALGEPLPKQVFGHPWLLQGDGKMSKSKGNVIYADDLISFFGVDAVRYFVLHEMPFENDGVITWDLMVERMNSDLANTLGNLVNRTISMSNKYFGGRVENKKVGVDAGAEDVDADLHRVLTDTYSRVSKKMDELRVADAITEIFTLFKRSNKYIDETMPWVLAKDEAKQDRLATVLYNLSNAIMVGASLLEPYMPETAKRIAEQMNAPLIGFEVLEQCAAKGDTTTAAALFPSGNQVTQKPEILFARQDIAEVLEKVEEMFAQRNAANGEETDSGMDKKVVELEPKAEITYDIFDKCQFQVGLVLECEEVPKSKKLLKFKIQVGGSTRQILSGIKQYYKSEELVGKRVMVLVNLQPREIAGMMSEGMILSAADEEGNLAVMTPERFMPAGAEIC
ncbi:MAG: methionine--tRNA ligase subunit beta, partial [Lachnospiraceae bacterium]|nr:methionine--tRNA ligase subunit beta [Lachnospiraceae bacterium]